MIKKNADWQNDFQAFIEGARWEPFVWGEWDCCKFADAAIFSYTKAHVIPSSLQWTDEQTAKDAIKGYGKTLLGSLKKACKEAGLAQIESSFITTGDLVLFASSEGHMVGIADGLALLAPSENGLTVHDPSLAMRAWRVPA